MVVGWSIQEQEFRRWGEMTVEKEGRIAVIQSWASQATQPGLYE